MKKLFSFFAAVLFAGSLMAQALGTDTISCDSAKVAALAGKTDSVIVKGYVTSIAEQFNVSKKNVSFWMADTEDGGQVFEAYRVACEMADEVPAIGSLVWVKGKLTKYKTTPEIAAGGTFGVLEAAAPAVNLGQKTIAEFLALKNMKDTCVVTGVVADIVMDKDDSTKYNKFGNFYLVDGTDSLYIYGLLTADGQKGKFQEMGVDAEDTLTVKAIYTEYKGKAQAQNAIFVSVSKKQEPQVEEVDIIAATGVQIYKQAAYWQVLSQTDQFVISLLAMSAELAGTYNVEDLYADYSFVMTDFENKTKIGFTAGQIVVTVDAETSAVAFVGKLTGADGKVYNVHLTYVEPKAETTVPLTYAEAQLKDYTGEAQDPAFQVQALDYTNMTMVSLVVYTSVIAGEYTEANLNPNYSYVYADGAAQTIYTATITVTANADGSYTIVADLLCYNNTLYKVTMTVPAPQGVETIDAAQKAVKRIQNGQLIIEKNGVKYTILGSKRL